MTFKIYATLCLASITLLSGCASSLSAPSPATPEGLITLTSPRSAKETMDKLEASVKEKGFAVVARVDHAAGATRVGKTLRATELLIFGNAADGVRANRWH